MKNQVCIVIPIYKDELNIMDRISLESLLRHITHEDIAIIHPRSLDIFNTIKQDKKISESLLNRSCIFKSFGDEYFTSTESYSKMMMSHDFYCSFVGYEYILIYQTDVFMTKNDIKEWCDKGYDYVGAPIISPSAGWKRVPFVGNGGCSLRKVQTFIDITDPNGEFLIECGQDIQKECEENPDYIKFEDLYFAELVSDNWEFNKPSYANAAKFAWDMNVDVMYNQFKEFPSFIHAFGKNIEFWRTSLFIELHSKELSDWCENEYSELLEYYHLTPLEKKYSVCVIVKNENAYIKEFINHYLSLGFTDVYVYDNNDDDGENPNDIIKDIEGAHYIDILRGVKFDNQHRRPQFVCYEHCYSTYPSDWMLFVDADEFLELGPFASIKDFVESNLVFYNTNAIYINRIEYSDNNLIEPSSEPCVTRFTQQSNHQDYLVKALVKGGNKKINMDNPHFVFGITACDIDGKWINNVDPHWQTKNIDIHIKHFPTKTIKEFLKYKFRRGFPDHTYNEGIIKTGIDYFIERNEITPEKEAIISEFFKS